MEREYGQAGQGPLVELKAKLRRRQEPAGLSGDQLAARTGLSTTTLHNAINDPGKVPTAQTLRLRVPKLNLDLDEPLDLRGRAVGQRSGRSVEEAEAAEAAVPARGLWWEGRFLSATRTTWKSSPRRRRASAALGRAT